MGCGWNTFVVNNAVVDADLAWSKTIPIGISLKQHYEGFQEKIEVAKQKVYQKTQRFMPNYMLVSSTIMPVVAMIDAFRPSDVTKINGQNTKRLPYIEIYKSAQLDMLEHP